MEGDIGLEKVQALQRCCRLCSVDWIPILDILNQEYFDLQILTQLTSIHRQSKFEQTLYINRYIIPHAAQEILNTLYMVIVANSKGLNPQDNNKLLQNPSVSKVSEILANWASTLEQFINTCLICYGAKNDVQVLRNVACALLLLQSEIYLAQSEICSAPYETATSLIGKAIHITERALEEFENIPQHSRLCLYCIPFKQACKKIFECFPPIFSPWLRDDTEFQHRMRDRICYIAENPIFQQMQISNILDIEKCGLWSCYLNRNRRVRRRINTSVQTDTRHSLTPTRVTHSNEDSLPHSRSSADNSAEYIKIPNISEENRCIRRYSSSTQSIDIFGTSSSHKGEGDLLLSRRTEEFQDFLPTSEAVIKHNGKDSLPLYPHTLSLSNRRSSLIPLWSTTNNLRYIGAFPPLDILTVDLQSLNNALDTSANCPVSGDSTRTSGNLSQLSYNASGQTFSWDSDLN